MKEVLQQSIDFAEYCLEELDLSYMASNQAKRLIEKSRQAIAEAEKQEPYVDVVSHWHYWMAEADKFRLQLENLRQAIAEAEKQEPVAWLFQDRTWTNIKAMADDHPPTVPVYTTPQQRTWVGLTDRDIEAIWGEDVSLMYSGHYDAVRAIEAKLKEKNTQEPIKWSDYESDGRIIKNYPEKNKT